MIHCNVQYLHDQLIPFAAVINLIIVAWDDAAGIRMVIPINCMVTISSAAARVGSGIEAGNLYELVNPMYINTFATFATWEI